MTLDSLAHCNSPIFLASAFICLEKSEWNDMICYYRNAKELLSGLRNLYVCLNKAYDLCEVSTGHDESHYRGSHLLQSRSSSASPNADDDPVMLLGYHVTL
ncbi:unnamed protein product [Hymenolepis diminuta]|uniref:Uncharacterized protein n=1 Tax=Hymenolepis diminuta TaxID=6216 RepID=A0A564ZA69_HYMDI|nr:unnamed protein product [Hymenolepis diminuta]VUZ56391.1 unnamed protein product [Hymenolepis diminuta]VUZ56394.1 unnamed protein product [Hymenolepis diminuta]